MAHFSLVLRALTLADEATLRARQRYSLTLNSVFGVNLRTMALLKPLQTGHRTDRVASRRWTPLVLHLVYARDRTSHDLASVDGLASI